MKSKLAVLGIGEAPPVDETDEDAELMPEDEDSAEAKAEAGSAFASAVKSGDGAAIADAFSDLMAVCKGY